MNNNFSKCSFGGYCNRTAKLCEHCDVFDFHQGVTTSHDYKHSYGPIISNTNIEYTRNMSIKDKSMDNLNLIEYLKDAPRGLNLYSPMYGEVKFDRVEVEGNYPIICTYIEHTEKFYCRFTKQGRCQDSGECVLFPTRDQFDWFNFTTSIPDKALILCQDNNLPYGCELRFYDAKNDCTFSCKNGKRNGTKFTYYEIYQGRWPDWANYAVKNLED